VSLPLLPGRFKNSDVIFFEGIPFAPNKKRSKLMLNYLDKAKNTGKKIVLDLYDDPAFQRRDLLGQKVDVDIWENIRNTFLNQADIVLFPSSSMRKYYVQNELVDDEKTCVLMNASDPDHFKVSKPPEKCVVGLLTGVGPGRGIEILLEAFVQVKKKLPNSELRIGCRVSGKGDLDYLEKIRRKFKNQDIHFETTITYPGASDFLAGCSICAIPHIKSFYTDLATPIKLFDYMAAGRPVVSTNCEETAHIIGEERSGLVTDFSADSFSRGIIDLWMKEKERLRMGKNAREAIIKRHSWNIRIKELSKMINDII
jgi:glycosyltransferase involved in cell wall biosynthesis